MPLASAGARQGRRGHHTDRINLVASRLREGRRVSSPGNALRTSSSTTIREAQDACKRALNHPVSVSNNLQNSFWPIGLTLV